VHSLFAGFGISPAEFGPELKRRLLALMLLHRASDLVGHLRIDRWQDQAGDLFELADLLWPV